MNVEELDFICLECEKPQRYLISRAVISKPKDPPRRIEMCEACWVLLYGQVPVQGSYAKGTSLGQHLYCPTCGKGWIIGAATGLHPRECYRCRNNGASLNDPHELQKVLGSAARLRRAQIREEQPTALSVPTCTEMNLNSGRCVPVEPNHDLVTDIERTKHMRYVKSGLGGWEWEPFGPKRYSKRRK